MVYRNVEVILGFSDGTKIARIEDLADVTNFLEQHEEYVKVVRCKDCKHRIVNEHYGEKGYRKLKAMCELDTGDPFERGRCAENDEWFCADGAKMDEVEECLKHID